ncbi:MAG TPA: sulfotransferase domain-containing protein [Opitutus sp.]|nr:sulfotransferase domain-containing protein [Opitutus sp.]
MSTLHAESSRLPRPVSNGTPAWKTLKILIASTPKTGNTWLKYLLSAIYELPVADLSPNYRDGVAGERWVGHQHYLPESGLLAWARKEGVNFVTTVRHPGDVLVSLRHHVNRNEVGAVGANDPASMLRDGEGFFGEHTRRYVEHGYFLMLHVSLAWSQGGWARVVHYEDLWRDPAATLQRLTDAILPVPGERIRAAVKACELERMRKRFPSERKFYRRGGSGEWVRELPWEVQRMFQSDPYPAQFAALGYEPVAENRRPDGTSLAAEWRRCWTTLRCLPLVFDIWMKLAPARQVRWVDAARGSISCLAWLNRPAAEDERMPTQFPFVTKLALGLYLREPRMAQSYPDPLGVNRSEFANWFLYHAPRMFHLDRSFVVPTLHAWTDRSPRACHQAI